MPILQPPFVEGGYYHLLNRGIGKQDLFIEDKDYERGLRVFSFYVEQKPATRYSIASLDKLKHIITSKPDKPLVEIVAYCLMPNHFHLLVRQITKNGITTFMRRSLNSYTRYFNTKYNRKGTIFEGTFRAVAVESDEQLLHLSRYIHLNPFAAGLTNEPLDYSWYSYNSFLKQENNRLNNSQLIMELIGSPAAYQEFVEDYADYARSLAAIKDLTHD